MDHNFIYFLRKGIMVYTNKNDSYVVSYLLDKPYKEEFYIEKSLIPKLIKLLDKCHINYYYYEAHLFDDNKYSKYLKYGILTNRIDKLSKNLKNCLYLDNIEEIISNMEKFNE